ncbi:MAG: type 4a pilus biogenesis protein PilO [Dehalococcoidia bacterium]
MNYLQNWREYIPAKERLYPLLAIVAIVVIGLGYFLFINSSIVPQLRVRKELAIRLASAEKELRETQKAKEGAPETLEEQVATAEATLNEAANVFLSESQAAEALNKLYQYASESGVEITSMQAQPNPEEKKDIYDVRMFQLQVEGALPKLMDFISRIKEAAFKSFVIANVNITEGEELHILTMDITLYTSPYSPGAAVQAMPGVTPAETPTNLPQLIEELAIALASREWDQVIGLIKQILGIDPYYDGMVDALYAAHVNYGYQLLEEGDTGGATAQFQAALEIKPDGEEAIAGLQRATTTPTPTSTVEQQLEQRLDEAWAAENWEEVISLIEQIVAINPYYDTTEKLYAAHVNYGHKLAAEGKLEEAKEEFSRALGIKPDGEEAIAGLRDLAGETPTPPPTLISPPPPPPPTPTSPSQETIYVVRRGDTLYSIARRYGTTVQAIMAANGLTNYNIYVGQQLNIPTP